jgi:hypothetical protein
MLQAPLHRCDRHHKSALLDLSGFKDKPLFIGAPNPSTLQASA